MYITYNRAMMGYKPILTGIVDIWHMGFCALVGAGPSIPFLYDEITTNGQNNLIKITNWIPFKINTIYCILLGFNVGWIASYSITDNHCLFSMLVEQIDNSKPAIQFDTAFVKQFVTMSSVSLVIDGIACYKQKNDKLTYPYRYHKSKYYKYRIYNLFLFTAFTWSCILPPSSRRQS